MGRMNCEQESRFVNTLPRVMQRHFSAFCSHNPRTAKIIRSNCGTKFNSPISLL
jgi:hypothetical protein